MQKATQKEHYIFMPKIEENSFTALILLCMQRANRPCGVRNPCEECGKEFI